MGDGLRFVVSSDTDVTWGDLSLLLHNILDVSNVVECLGLYTGVMNEREIDRISIVRDMLCNKFGRAKFTSYAYYNSLRNSE